MAIEILNHRTFTHGLIEESWRVCNSRLQFLQILNVRSHANGRDEDKLSSKLWVMSPILRVQVRDAL